jgi:hypothetical protein
MLANRIQTTIENRPETVRSGRLPREAKFFVAQAFTGPFRWLTRTSSSESVGRGFEPRGPIQRGVSTAPASPTGELTIV